jgi:protein-disulfide isomerase
MNKKVLGIIAAVIALSAVFWIATKPSDTTTKTSSKPTTHTTGKGTTGVTLVEYGDFQCPACGAYYPVVKQIKEEYGDKITFQFRNFPLESLHKNARAGARAAEAANMQGKFWEMHDQLYENQTAWQDASDPLSFYKNYATAVGIKDLTRFEADYRSTAVNDLINADLQEGNKVPVTSTPTFILDGKKLEDNPTSIEAFKVVLDAAIAKKAPAADAAAGTSQTSTETGTDVPADGDAMSR